MSSNEMKKSMLKAPTFITKPIRVQNIKIKMKLQKILIRYIVDIKMCFLLNLSSLHGIWF